MLKQLSHIPIRYPRAVLLVVLALTVLAALQIRNLHWETDARVYFPPGHPAIEFDELVADKFHVKDSIIIAIVNENGVFNPETMARVARITEKLSGLPGALAQRQADIASLASATVFTGTDDELVTLPLLETPHPTEADVERLKKLVYDNPDLFVGNLASSDGKATMIRVKLKEGINYRYMSYFQVRAMLMEELNSDKPSTAWGGGAGGGGAWSGGQQQWSGGEGGGEWGKWDPAADLTTQVASNGDRFYMAGRPVIEVTSGQHALSDLKIMIPLLLLTICVVLFVLFRTMRGVLLPLAIVAIACIWNAGAMAFAGVPMYTISTMLPVIMIAVGIADALHILSHFQDLVVEDAQRDQRSLVTQLMNELNPPLLITTLTTVAGFLSLWWAQMPPFRMFGVFTALGLVFCWLVSITMVPAALMLMRPRVGGYLARRRAMRIHNENGFLARVLVRGATGVMKHRGLVAVVVLGIMAVVGYGVPRLYVDSSWLGDFRKDSEVVISNNMLNDKFDGTIFLNVVVDGGKPDALKSPVLLNRMQDLIKHVEAMPYVGGSVSLIDYLKTVNKSLHAGDPAYSLLPETQEEIGEYLFLLSVSGRPELLDEVVNYNYSIANITFAIRTDHTQDLQAIINDTRDWVSREMSDLPVTVNYAGSANNSSVWAELLITSQILAILLSKIGILVTAALLYRSLAAGIITVIPITVTTAVVAGAAGWLNIPMDVSTVLAATVAIGVGVDYTVHYISRYMLERERGIGEHESVLSATRSAGKPIVFNAVVVAAGFLVLGLSQFPPHVKLGYFVATYMVIACTVALVVLPLAFAYLRPRRERAQSTAASS
ncbi:MAG: MMPL family transporter [Chromatiales bacterium]|nr:MMPL family transporter [Chromatiales bacterium]